MTGLSTGTTRSLATKKFSLKLGSFLSRPKGLSPANELFVVGAEFAVRAGIPAIPLKLLGDDFDDGGVFLAGKFVHRAGPNGNGEADEQDGFKDGDDAFDVSGGVAFDAGVIGLGIAAFMKAHDDVKEVTNPADKQERPSKCGHK